MYPIYPLSVGIPEDEWVESEDKTSPVTNLFYALVLFGGSGGLIFALILTAGIFLQRTNYITENPVINNPYLYLGISFIISGITAFATAKGKHPHMSLSTKVTREGIKEAIDTALMMSLNTCGSRYRIKRKRSGKFQETVYYNNKIRVRLYIADDETFATIKIEDYRKEDNTLIYCIQQQISETLGISDKRTPFREVLNRENAEIREKLKYG